MVQEGSIRVAPRAGDRARSSGRREPDITGDREASASRRGRRLSGRSLARRSRGAGKRTLATVALTLVLTACALPQVSAGPRSPDAPTPTASAAASEAATESPPASDVADGSCTADRVSGAITTWEGAAGSRIAWVVVTNGGDVPCALAGPPAAVLVDGAGAILIASQGQVGGAESVELLPGDDAQLLVAVANWCDDPPRPPVSIGLTLPGGVQLVVPPADGVVFEPPPCNGPGQPATISVQEESWMISTVCCNRLRSG
jgi:Protein of unknown function (DUF4232)